MEGLFSIANEEYYIDLDNVSQFIRMEPSIDELLQSPLEYDEENQKKPDLVEEKQMLGNHQMMDVAKWEIVRGLLESLLNENGIIDESMGIKKLEKQLSISFRLAFNTLLKYKIIKKNG
tara:strand:- start:187 stop:543 length:357 start_codon:yes stop_codon:yes gene_type:complete